MARKRKLTISEELELQWDDGFTSCSEVEKDLRHEFEMGWKELSRTLEHDGHTQLKFDPKELIL
jgi:hypothetical protein